MFTLLVRIKTEYLYTKIRKKGEKKEGKVAIVSRKSPRFLAVKSTIQRDQRRQPRRDRIPSAALRAGWRVEYL